MGREIRHDAAVKAAQHFVTRLAAEFLVQLARAGWKPYGEGWRRADCYRSIIPCFFSFVYNVERLRLSSSVTVSYTHLFPCWPITIPILGAAAAG